MKTKGPEETLRLGRILGAMLASGAVVALMGDLGSGKTVLAKGIAKGLGVEDEREVTSPSFVLVNEYPGRIPIHHVDLYRLRQWEEVENLGWEELISETGVTLVEWAEKVPTLLPEERMDVHLQWVSTRERKLLFVGKGNTAKHWVANLRERWMKEE